MGLLTRSKERSDPAVDKRAERARLIEEIAGLRVELEHVGERTDLAKRNEDLKQQIHDQELALAKKEEEHASKMREIEHKVGLQQQKAEQDQENAIREAKLTVREENTDADRKRFEQQMEFEREAMEKRSSEILDVLGKVMNALPNVNQNIHTFTGDVPGGEEGRRELAAGSSE